MERALLTIDELIDFCTNNLSIMALVYSRKAKILTYFLLALMILSSFGVLVVSFINTNSFIGYSISIGIFLFFLASVIALRRKMLKNLPANVSLSQLKLLGLETFLISKNISRQNLEHIQKIMIKEEANAKRTFTFILPGAVLLLPLWNAFLNKYFSNMPQEVALDFFGQWAIILIFVSFIFWLYKQMLISIFSEKQSLLKTINRLIEELLINGYELKHK